MAMVKVGNAYYNDKYYKQPQSQAYIQKEESGAKGFINKIGMAFGKGKTPPKLVNEDEEYTKFRLMREEENKKGSVKNVVKAGRELINPSYGYSREDIKKAQPTIKDKLKGGLNAVARFATDITSLVPLGIQGVGALTKSDTLKNFGAQAGEQLEKFKQTTFQPSTVGEAKVAGFTELGLNVFPAGTLGKGKIISKLAKLDDTAKIEKLLIAEKMLPKGLAKEDVLRVAESLKGVKDEKSILNTIYAESIFKKAELEIGRKLPTKAKMMVELSVKTTPIEDPKAFRDQMVEKIKSTLPPEQQITKNVDTAGATIERNAVGDIVRITEKDGKLSYENPKYRLADEGDDLVSQAQKMKSEGKSFDEFVKAQGTPVYHGTKKKFDSFDLEKSNIKRIEEFGGVRGASFTGNKKVAERYANAPSNTFFDDSIIAEIKNKNKYFGDYVESLYKGREFRIKSEKEFERLSGGYSLTQANDIAAGIRGTKVDLGGEGVKGFGGVDFNENAANFARRTLEKLGLGDSIKTRIKTRYIGGSKLKDIGYIEPKGSKSAEEIVTEMSKKAKKDGFDGIIFETEQSIGEAPGRMSQPEFLIFEPNKLKTKSQLTDIWEKVNSVGAMGIKTVKKPGIAGERGLKKVGLGTEKKLVTTTKTEKQLLKDKVKIQSRTAKKVATDVKKADYDTMNRLTASYKRRLKEAKKDGKKAKAIGKKIGVFQQKAKDKAKLKQVFLDYRKKKTTIESFKKSARQYASDLPKKERDKIFSMVKFDKMKTGKNLKSLLDKIDASRLRVAINREKLILRQEIGHLRKVAREKDVIGEVKMQVRKELGIKNDQAMKNSSLDKLKRYKEILLEKMKNEPPTLKDVNFKEMKEAGTSITKTQEFIKSAKRGIESALGVASTNIRKILGDKVFYKLREMEMNVSAFSKKYFDKIEKFEDTLMKIKDTEDRNKLAYFLNNQAFDEARVVAAKYKFEKELENVIEVLEDIHKRANEAGLPVGKLVNYFPRIVKDYDGLFKAYSKMFGKEGRSYLDKLLTAAANKKSKTVKELTDEERGDILTKAIRGYGQGKINVGNVTRSRKFKHLPAELIQYYHKPETALQMYVAQMNKRIELKKLFGLNNNEQESIGSIIDGLRLSPDDMQRAKDILVAMLSPQGKENAILNTLRKSATLTLLAHVASTLFQIADIGLNAYKHGGMRALASLFKAKPFRRDEILLNIMHEFSDSTVIKKSLKAVGFDKLDQINSEAFMAEAFRKAGREAKLGKGDAYNRLAKKLEPMFQGDKEKAKKVLDDLANQRVNDDTRFYVFNEILDVSPRALMEMPEAYIKNPNARIFYSMKSYGIKVLDVFRNDVVRNWKKNPKQSVKNFVKLSAYLTMAGASGSQIRDWYNGKDTKFSDNVINNMIQIMMVSSYDVNNIQRDGLGKTLLTKALPPSRVIDDISKDLLSLGDDKGFKTLRDIPIVGGDLYNRVGQGREQIIKDNKK